MSANVSQCQPMSVVLHDSIKINSNNLGGVCFFFFKNTSVRDVFSSLFWVFGKSGKTRHLVFDILLPTLLIFYRDCAVRRIFNSLIGVWKMRWRTLSFVRCIIPTLVFFNLTNSLLYEFSVYCLLTVITMFVTGPTLQYIRGRCRRVIGPNDWVI